MTGIRDAHFENRHRLNRRLWHFTCNGKPPMIAKRKVSFSTASFGIRGAPLALSFLITFGLLTFATETHATVAHEQDIVDLRLGQRVKGDDGSCPAGQIKEVSGTKMTETGVLRARKCVPRVGPKI